jgi:hypothetical protein
VALVLASILTASASAAKTTTENPFSTASQSFVYFVPLDEHARSVLRAVAPTMSPWLPGAMVVTDIATNRKDWAGAGHGGDLTADTISKDLLARFARSFGKKPVYLIAVTSHAIYSTSFPYNFVFGFLSGIPGTSQYATIYGLQPMRAYQPEREQARLRKMMLRYVGQVWCGLRKNKDRTSVLYETVMGTPDLDRMAPTLPTQCRRPD